MGLRFLAGAALLGLLVYFLRNRLRELLAMRQTRRPQPLQKTVRCSHCGTFVSESQAIARNGAFYCCAGHAATAQAEES